MFFSLFAHRHWREFQSAISSKLLEMETIILLYLSINNVPKTSITM